MFLLITDTLLVPRGFRLPPGVHSRQLMKKPATRLKQTVIHLMHFHSHCPQSVPLGSACHQFTAHSVCHCATGCSVDTAELCGAADM